MLHKNQKVSYSHLDPRPPTPHQDDVEHFEERVIIVTVFKLRENTSRSSAFIAYHSVHFRTKHPHQEQQTVIAISRDLQLYRNMYEQIQTCYKVLFPSGMPDRKPGAGKDPGRTGRLPNIAVRGSKHDTRVRNDIERIVEKEDIKLKKSTVNNVVFKYHHRGHSERPNMPDSQITLHLDTGRSVMKLCDSNCQVQKGKHRMTPGDIPPLVQTKMEKKKVLSGINTTKIEKIKTEQTSKAERLKNEVESQKYQKLTRRKITPPGLKEGDRQEHINDTRIHTEVYSESGTTPTGDIGIHCESPGIDGDDSRPTTPILPEILTSVQDSPNVDLESRLDDNLNANIDEPPADDNGTPMVTNESGTSPDENLSTIFTTLRRRATNPLENKKKLHITTRSDPQVYDSLRYSKDADDVDLLPETATKQDTKAIESPEGENVLDDKREREKIKTNKDVQKEIKPVFNDESVERILYGKPAPEPSKPMNRYPDRKYYEPSYYRRGNHNVHKRAYLLALSDAAARRANKNPETVERPRRSFYFSYFPLYVPKGQRPPEGYQDAIEDSNVKGGLKHILGNLDLKDYYPGGSKYSDREIF